jgi:hypothetical protein
VLDARESGTKGLAARGVQLKTGTEGLEDGTAIPRKAESFWTSPNRNDGRANMLKTGILLRCFPRL